MKKYYSQLLSLVLLGGVVAPVSSLEADRKKPARKIRTTQNNQGNGKSSLDTLKTFGLTSRKSQNQNSAVASGNSNTQPQKTAGATSTGSTTMGNTNPNPQKLNSIIVTGNSKAQTPASASQPSNTKIAENSNTMETIVDLLKQWNLLQAQIEARVSEIRNVDPSYSLEEYRGACGRLWSRRSAEGDHVTKNDLTLLSNESEAQDKFQSTKEKLIDDITKRSNKSKEQAEILLRVVTDQMQKLDPQKVRNVDCLIEIQDAIEDILREIDKKENPKQSSGKQNPN